MNNQNLKIEHKSICICNIKVEVKCLGGQRRLIGVTKEREGREV